MTTTTIPMSAILDLLGISVETNDRWRVAKIRENGTAARTGIKVGDVITAFDDQDVNTKASFVNFGSISAITVRRDGKLIPLMVVSR
jgi:S1-C subfamily serine protease